MLKIIGSHGHIYNQVIESCGNISPYCAEVAHDAGNIYIYILLKLNPMPNIIFAHWLVTLF